MVLRRHRWSSRRRVAVYPGWVRGGTTLGGAGTLAVVGHAAALALAQRRGETLGSRLEETDVVGRAQVWRPQNMVCRFVISFQLAMGGKRLTRDTTVDHVRIRVGAFRWVPDACV